MTPKRTCISISNHSPSFPSSLLILGASDLLSILLSIISNSSNFFTYICILFQIVFHYRSLQDIEYSSLTCLMHQRWIIKSPNIPKGRKLRAQLFLPLVLPPHFKREELEAERNEGSCPRSPINLRTDAWSPSPPSGPIALSSVSLASQGVGGRMSLSSRTRTRHVT